MSQRSNVTFNLRISILEATDLAIADSFSRSSDPYAVVSLLGPPGSSQPAQRIHKTKVIKRTLNPHWEENVSLDSVRSDAVVEISVYDWDRFKKDDFLGTATLPLEAYANKGPVDEWFLLFDKSARPCSGRLHVIVLCTIASGSLPGAPVLLGVHPRPPSPSHAAASGPTIASTQVHPPKALESTPWTAPAGDTTIRRKVFTKWVNRTLGPDAIPPGGDAVDGWSPVWFQDLLLRLCPIPGRPDTAPANETVLTLFRGICSVPPDTVLDAARLGSSEDSGAFTLRVLWETFVHLVRIDKVLPLPPFPLSRAVTEKTTTNAHKSRDPAPTQLLSWLRSEARQGCVPLPEALEFPSCLFIEGALFSVVKNRFADVLPTPGFADALAALESRLGLESYLSAEEIMSFDEQSAAVWCHGVYCAAHPAMAFPRAPLAPPTSLLQPARPLPPTPSGPAAAIAPTDPAVALVCAARDGKIDVVRSLLGTVPVDSLHENKTALIHAAWNGDLPIVRLLVENGATIDMPNKFNSAPLLLAAANGHLDVVRFLVESGAAVSRTGQNNWTAAEAARRQNHPDVAAFLDSLSPKQPAEGASAPPLTASAMAGTGTETGAEEEKAFVEAARDGNIELVGSLLGTVKVDCRYESKTALIHAAWNGNLPLVTLLIENGANVELPNKYNSAPLLLAAANGHLDVVRFLVETGGADVTRKGQNNWTAEEAARAQGHPDVAEYLARRVKMTSAPQPKPPLAGLGQLPRLETVPPAMRHGSAAAQPATETDVRFICAARDGDVEAVVSLLQTANVNAVHENKTALIHAAWNGNLAIVKILVNSGANVEIANKYNSTPLLLAAANGHLDVVRFLVESGHADSKKRGQGDMTPEEAARAQGHPEVADYLSQVAPAAPAPASGAFNLPEDGKLFECPVCLEGKPRSLIEITPCNHAFCKICLRVIRQLRPFCPLCRAPIGEVPASMAPPTAQEWSIETARARLSEPDARGMRNVQLVGADGRVSGTNIHVATGAHITVAPGTNLVINGQRVENPENCSQQ